jgi:hypothetical protein
MEDVKSAEMEDVEMAPPRMQKGKVRFRCMLEMRLTFFLKRRQKNFLIY